MNFPVDVGPLRIGLVLLLLLGVALVVFGLLGLRRTGLRAALVRGSGGLAVLVVATTLLWIATLLQTYLGLTGEIKAAHVVAEPVPGQEHHLDVALTLYGDDGRPEHRENYRVEGDLWVLQAGIVELHPWVNALGFHSGYRISRLYGQRLDGEATTQRQIFLGGGDQDFFADMREGRWWTQPFVRSAYGNAVIAVPGEYDVYISTDAIKTRPAGS
ncbi:hypothetical protein [Nocardia sp. CNY236]|uniref:hypothetical protein n=1 Tax=Nocardia sp. CNY236 TaxID=1169152 RepID=UPI0004283CE7|nr:hypothetical protein [Nocardia sp. CNY236]